jgi:16S rRNA (cytidine1402-2'-O)-methyltransferase
MRMAVSPQNERRHTIPGTLYVVATPIGNLEDLSFRAVRVLREVRVIACEDTRHTRLLLQQHGIATPLVSYHEHNEQTRTPELVRRLQAGESVALVSDAGTPLLSDPGYTLIRRAIAAGVPVVPIPGPSAITAALSVAGLPTDRFVFLGFLPRKTAERRRALEAVAAIPWTLVLFEAPTRTEATLRDLEDVLGDRPVALVRELTKRFEEALRGSLAEVRDQVEHRPLRGEVTLIVGGTLQAVPSVGDPREELKTLLAAGTPTTEAVRQVAKRHGLPRRAVYDLAVHLRGEHAPRRNP